MALTSSRAKRSSHSHVLSRALAKRVVSVMFFLGLLIVTVALVVPIIKILTNNVVLAQQNRVLEKRILDLEQELLTLRKERLLFLSQFETVRMEDYGQ